jgi:GTP cyclohydrolase II
MKQLKVVKYARKYVGKYIGNALTAAVNFRTVQVRQSVRIPINKIEGDFITFRGLSDSEEHIAIGLGDWKNTPTPLVRIHSECLTGDVFASGKCDCGEQLKESIEMISRSGGVILYLRQEGRGIGLYNKLDAYALQATGLDTYDANLRLGLKTDLRSYAVAAEMLRALSLTRIKLLSNNPDKLCQLREAGIEVTEQISTGVFVKSSNKKYLEAKVRVTKHRIEFAHA